MLKNLLSLGALFFLVGCGNSEGGSNIVAQSDQHAAKPVVKDVNAVDFNQLIMDYGEDVMIIDVRTPAECSEGVVEGAIKINFYDNDFQDQVAKLPKDKKVLVYCRSGGRSKNAQQIMARSGFSEIYNLEGGMSAWLGKGLPVVK